MLAFIIVALISATVIAVTYTGYAMKKNACSQIVECRLVTYDEKIHAAPDLSEPGIFTNYYEQQMKSDRDRFMDIGRRAPVEFSPVYAYTVNDKVYKIRSNIYTPKRNEALGNIIPLFVDPDHPERKFFPEPEKARLTYICAVAAAVPVIMLLFLFLFGE